MDNVAFGVVRTVSSQSRTTWWSDLGLSSQPTTGFGLEAGQRSRRSPCSSGRSLDKVTCFTRSATRRPVGRLVVRTIAEIPRRGHETLGQARALEKPDLPDSREREPLIEPLINAGAWLSTLPLSNPV